MNKRLPYEEELSKRLNDLPLPDENASWEDMKRRLDEDRDDGVIIPPLRKGCLGYSLLLALLAIVIWMVVPPAKWPWNKNQNESVLSGKVDNGKKDTTIDSIAKDSPKRSGPTGSLVTHVKDLDTVARNNKERLTKDLLKETDRHKKDPSQKILTHRPASISEYAKPGSTYRHKTRQEKTNAKKIIGNKNSQKQNKKIEGSLKSHISGNEQDTDSSKNDNENINSKEPTITANDDTKIDSTKKATDTNAVKRKTKDITTPVKIVKQDSTAKKLIYFAAGVALHQQLPVNGQKLVPYNSLGRKSTVRDYIPSVYFRMYRHKKWFIQAEFRYGAPQYTKEILYAQKKVVDTFTRSTLDTSNRLKKTYYHQLPVSFNYFVLPHFSAGLGFIWNKFSSAVSEQEIKRTNNITQVDSVITKTVLRPKRADSNFVQSYFQALIESQYQWKRWSVGARYSFGLQPYIRFQLPGGVHREEKNSSLEIFLRYDLWQSRKK